MMVRTVLPLLLISATVFTTPALSQDGTNLQIIVSKQDQKLVVYDGTKVVATSRVSTGKEGHSTPSGIFSIIQKAKYHESNLYSNAPMPWMQRITWSGVALHQSSSVPNRPASHGCVRLPDDFARTLYGMTALGAHVIITDAPVTPVVVNHPFLFTPRHDEPQLLSGAKLRGGDAVSATKPVEVAMIDVPAVPKAELPTPSNPAPLRILITYSDDQQIVRDAQVLLRELGFDTGSTDGQTGPLTREAIRGFKRWKSLNTKGPLITPEFLTALYASAGKPMPPRGHLYVRQNFKPLFDAPVAIAHPDQPLGTYFLDAVDVNHQTGATTWQAVTLDNASPHKPQSSVITIGTHDGSNPSTSETYGLNAVLDRITIEPDIRTRIESTMTTGTSLTITDQGIGKETDEGTDFITILPPKNRS
ncbi:L,D-transpeptidase family protein [Rhizobium sp.]|uniref:L,D-transpeptidase family protein n=1 Tax=Rhizobium sp. TaxID=391 RepID=UPI000E856B32|nr:hypothetical protein [Rhizobium sp.]